MDIVRFVNPDMLWLSALIVPMVAYYVYRMRQGGATMRISTIDGVRRVPRTAKYYLRHLPLVLCCLAVALLSVALARPQSAEHNSNSTTEGIDIVLSLDVSGSMLARDFTPDRLGAAKEVASNFIVDRPNDRIGLVVFAGESFTQCPLTTDKRSLLNLLGGVRSGMIDDGTARDGHRQRTGDGREPPQGEQCEKQGGDPAHRRREQQRPDRAADRGRNR